MEVITIGLEWLGNKLSRSHCHLSLRSRRACCLPSTICHLHLWATYNGIVPKDCGRLVRGALANRDGHVLAYIEPRIHTNI